MSTVAEHLAAIEFYRTVGLHEAAHNEGWLFLNVHWKELAEAHPADEMADARDAFEKRVREQHPTPAAEARIAEWRAALSTRTAKGGQE